MINVVDSEYNAAPAHNDWWNDLQLVKEEKVITVAEFQELIEKYDLIGIELLALEAEPPREMMDRAMGLLNGRLKHLEIGFKITEDLDLRLDLLNLQTLQTLYVEFPIEARLKITS